jgi:2-hydroxycyclohexanecarboxyl-CoA dehydrogenase
MDAPMQDLEGKVVIITGAGQGVGRGMALAFGAAGSRVVLAGRTEAKVAAVADEIAGEGGDALALRCDVANADDVAATVAATIDRFGRVDGMINNAFCGNDQLPAMDTPDEYIQSALDSNLFGSLHFMQACYPHMKRQGGGSIINFASGAAIEGWAKMLTYAASKEAVRGMSRSVAREWGADNIRVNVISPQAMSPAMKAYSELNPEAFQGLLANTPMGRVGDPREDIGPVALFLISDASSYMTGHTLNVDGGLFTLR